MLMHVKMAASMLTKLILDTLNGWAHVPKSFLKNASLRGALGVRIIHGWSSSLVRILSTITKFR